MARALRVGVRAGIAGGAAMALFSMAAMWITGSGFWLPLNLIAHTFYRHAPLTSTFSVPALVIGLAVHMTVASIFGTAIALLAQRTPGSRSMVIAGGILFIAVVWPVMQYVVWYKIDEDAAGGFNDWIFAVAHLIFGVTAAGIASIAIANDEEAARVRARQSGDPRLRPRRGQGALDRALRVGVLGGIVGGTVMALFSMAAMRITGSGFWLPLNLIAHTFYRDAPLTSTFDGPALAVGLAVHMTVASIFGTAIALLARRMPGSRSLVIAGGILFIAVVWPVMQYLVWYKIDEQAAEGFTDWIFAVAHLMFGFTAAGVAAIAIADDERAARGRHAAVPAPLAPDPPPGSLFQPANRRSLPGTTRPDS